MLNGKTAVITGGSRGIGKAAAIKFAANGANIAIIYAGNDEAAAATVAEIEATGVKAKAYKVNVAEFEAVKETVAEIVKDFESIDILVNSAGVTRDGLIAMMKEENFDAVIDINLKGTFNMIRHCTPVFMKQRHGKIVNLTSVSGLTGNPGQANYSASKAGVIGLTKATAKELVGRNVTCNAVAPGFVETDMTANLSANNKLVDQIPMKRMAKAEEIAELIFFLASDSANYITGEVIRIDGGIAM
ncbi:MAG: 3-oxoacyl-[acyl-carrier-protein] reductase [Firmicutes bacterium]|nr:3-oxoacyl-[acyl-carrier-protein] reductase [Bacillota bacterium]